MNDLVIESLRKRDYEFKAKPLLIGGQAMEHYGLRESGDDVDFVIAAEDFEILANRHPQCRKEIDTDLGLCIEEVELWKSIYQHDYQQLSEDAGQLDCYSVISMEKLLLLKALGMNEQKHFQDLKLLVQRIRQPS